MANITLTIPLPVLTAGQYFKTRYRLLPAGAWSSIVNRTNAPFTLTGLSAGDYQLETILVNADASECMATYTGFKVVNDFTCIDFDAEIVQTGSLYQMHITYTLPGGFTNPPCGWDIILQTSTGVQKIPYASLPVGGIIKLSVANVATLVRMRANLCDGNYKYCYDEDVSPVVPTCTPLTIVKAELIKPTGFYVVRIFIYNSNPMTVTIPFSFKEISNFYPSGKSGQSFTGSILGPPLIPGPPYMFTTPVNPEGYPGEGIQYEGTLTDICGKSHYWKTNVLY